MGNAATEIRTIVLKQHVFTNPPQFDFSLTSGL